MTYNSPATKHWLIAVPLLLSSCGRNLDTIENVEAVQRLSGGSLCAEAQVALANKDELEKSLQKDNLQFMIDAPAMCLIKFGQSLFTSTQLRTCSFASGHACIKRYNGEMLSIYWHTQERLEMNTWS